MAIYLFWSCADASVFGFTSDPAGMNLPGDLGPWSKNGDGLVTHVNDPGETPSSIINRVLDGGYHIASIDSQPAIV